MNGSDIREQGAAASDLAWHLGPVGHHGRLTSFPVLNALQAAGLKLVPDTEGVASAALYTRIPDVEGVRAA